MKIQNPKKKTVIRDGGVRILATAIVSLTLVLILLLILALFGLFWDDPTDPGNRNPVYTVNTDGVENRPKPPIEDTNNASASFELRCIRLEAYSSSNDGEGYVSYTLRIYKRGTGNLRITDLSCTQYMGTRSVNTVYLATESNEDSYWGEESYLDLPGEMVLNGGDSLMFVIKWVDDAGRTGGTYIIKNLEDYMISGHPEQPAVLLLQNGGEGRRDGFEK
ncbi:MAG: hypothetical protein ACI3XR_01130 [Eubacteriales bacterium]